LPGPDNIFNAFSVPMDKVKYVLFGESPYPRPQSANGYAFWDAAVTNIWSITGLSKQVNRANSLRNLIKMLLVADGLLSKENLSQEAIAAINKQKLVTSGQELFNSLLNKGFLLLNASLVFRKGLVNEDAKAWQPFLYEVLHTLTHKESSV